jgi:formate dehydrogenase iron-sulfur subunit
VACKEWNQLPDDGYEWSGHSYDNTQALGHSTWRHVKFVEDTPEPAVGGNLGEQLPAWSFSSDVCKHCEGAGCLEACPTGAIVRMEFGAVFIQPDICNGCSYCVVSCPFGVVQRNEEDGRAFKCTFCSDRQRAGLKPACAQACPTESIRFGPLDELRDQAQDRLKKLAARGIEDAVIYDPTETSVEGIHALFLMRGDPRTYNLPQQPEVPTIYQKKGWTSAVIAAGSMLALALLSFLGESK